MIAVKKNSGSNGRYRVLTKGPVNLKVIKIMVILEFDKIFKLWPIKKLTM